MDLKDQILRVGLGDFVYSALNEGFVQLMSQGAEYDAVQCHRDLHFGYVSAVGLQPFRFKGRAPPFTAFRQKL